MPAPDPAGPAPDSGARRNADPDIDGPAAEEPPEAASGSRPATTDGARADRVEILDHQGAGARAIDRDRLASVAREALARAGVAAAELSVLLVDDSQIHAINRKHLDHDWPTDVITFSMSDPDEPVLAGDLVISVETAARVAGGSGRDVFEEVALYLVHGILHLAGEDDATTDQALRMRRRESELLTAAGLPDPHDPDMVTESDTGTPASEAGRPVS